MAGGVRGGLLLAVLQLGLHHPDERRLCAITYQGARGEQLSYASTHARASRAGRTRRRGEGLGWGRGRRLERTSVCGARLRADHRSEGALASSASVSAISNPATTTTTRWAAPAAPAAPAVVASPPARLRQSSSARCACGAATSAADSADIFEGRKRASSVTRESVVRRRRVGLKSVPATWILIPLTRGRLM